MQEPLRIVVVGAGTMGRIHAEAARSNPRAILSAVVESDPSRRALADELGIPGYDALEKVDPALFDALVVAVPTDRHAALAIKAARMGKHVLVEKPMARTLDEARAMARAHQSAGTRLLVGQVVRYFPDYVRVRAAVMAGDVGQVAVVRSFRGGPYPRGTDDWYGDPARSGGLFLDLLIHDLDFLAWTFGAVTEITARIRTVDGRPRQATALVGFQNGVMAEMIGSWLHPRFHTRVEVAGSGGILSHNSLERATLVVERGGAERPQVAVPMSPAHRSPYQEEMDDFVNGILTGAPFRVDGEDAIRAVDLALLADAAAHARITLRREPLAGGDGS